MAGVDLQTLTAKRAATLPSVLAVAPHLQLSNLRPNQLPHQHVRLQPHPQHPQRKFPPTPPAVPIMVGPRAWVALSATAAAAQGGAARQPITAEAHVNQALGTVVVTTPQAPRARQNQAEQYLLLRLPQRPAAFFSA